MAQLENPIFRTKPTRSIALGQKEFAYGMMRTLKENGFRITEETTELHPPCRVTEYPGVCVYVEQWD